MYSFDNQGKKIIYEGYSNYSNYSNWYIPLISVIFIITIVVVLYFSIKTNKSVKINL